MGEKDCCQLTDVDEEYLLCNSDIEALKTFECDILTILGQKCETDEKADTIK